MNKQVKDNPDMFNENSYIQIALRAELPDFVAAIETNPSNLFELLYEHYYEYFFVYDDLTRWQQRVVVALMAKKTWLNEMLKTTQYVYNPIHNVDETLTETTAKKDDITDTVTKQDNITDTVTSSNHSDSGSYDFPMDSVNPKQTVRTDGSADGTTEQVSSVKSNQAQVSSGESNITRSLNRAGNIGVTSTQELIRQQRAIQVVLINFLYTILDDFLFLDVDRMEE